MIILGIDTSCDAASCAVLKNDVILEEKKILNKRKHSENLMPMVDEYLKENNIKSSDIDAFAVSSGPGSFTGLRIGMAALKTMAFSLNKKMVCVPTLDILANSYEKADITVCPIINARNDQVYTALYKWENDRYINKSEYMGIHISKLLEILNDDNDKIALCGDAVELHYEYFKKELNDKLLEYRQDFIFPKASVCVNLAKKMIDEGKAIEPEFAVPFYLRKSQAERLFNK